MPQNTAMSGQETQAISNSPFHLPISKKIIMILAITITFLLLVGAFLFVFASSRIAQSNKAKEITMQLRELDRATEEIINMLDSNYKSALTNDEKNKEIKDFFYTMIINSHIFPEPASKEADLLSSVQQAQQADSDPLKRLEQEVVLNDKSVSISNKAETTLGLLERGIMGITGFFTRIPKDLIIETRKTISDIKELNAFESKINKISIAQIKSYQQSSPGIIGNPIQEGIMDIIAAENQEAAIIKIQQGLIIAKDNFERIKALDTSKIPPERKVLHEDNIKSGEQSLKNIEAIITGYQAKNSSIVKASIIAVVFEDQIKPLRDTLDTWKAIKAIAQVSKLVNKWGEY